MSAFKSLPSRLITGLLRLLAFTWRVRLIDAAGLTKPGSPPLPPMIWVLWHNRLLVIPVLYERLFKRRKGVALVSQSKDGGLLAACIERFGGEAARGSSSRGGSAALANLKRKISEGYDAYITPDGPRGPRYSMGPGAIWLAQASGAKILRLGIEYTKVWRLGRWDGFVVPKPFAKIVVTLHPLLTVRQTTTPAEFESERLYLQRLMLSGTALL